MISGKDSRNTILLGLLVLALLLSSHLSSLIGASSSPLLISEVFYDTPGTDSEEEWVEIFNPTAFVVDLSGYKIGDEEVQGGTEGMCQFPSGASISPGDVIVVALEASGFYALYGFNPDFEVTDSDPTVLDMTPYSAWAAGRFALSNTGDEVLLLDESDSPVDVVVYEGGSYLGVTPHPGVETGHSLERVPADRDTDDCSADFIDQPSPNPGTVTIEVTPTPTPTKTPIVTPTHTPTPTATPTTTPTPTTTIYRGYLPLVLKRFN